MWGRLQNWASIDLNGEKDSPSSSSRAASRGTTPQLALLPPADLIIIFDHCPYDPKGFVFGSDDDECDILVHNVSGGRGISKKHFFVQFDWHSLELILTDTSSRGTEVRCRIFGRKILSHSTLPLAPNAEIRVGTLIMRVQLSRRGPNFGHYLKKYRREYEQALPRNLNGEIPESTSNQDSSRS